MDKRAEPLRILRRKQHLRQFLAVLVVLLVFLGGIAAGFLLQQGFQSSHRQRNTLFTHRLLPQQENHTPASLYASRSTQPVTEPPTEPSDPPTLPTETDPIQSIMDTMTLEEKLCQLFLVTPEAITPGDPITGIPQSLADDLRQYPVGGIVLFSQNLLNRQQCQTMVAAYQELSRIPMFVCVDEEGGAVSRLGGNAAMDFPQFGPMASIGASGENSDAYHVGYTLGSELLELGFNLDFAPVADVDSNPKNTVIGDRAFSTDPETAAKMVSACVRGFRDAGTLCTLKHFPGHGDTAQDSHQGEVTLNKTLEELQKTELPPFSAGIQAGAPVVMVGHISLPKITGSDVPASLSPELITDLLRDSMGFNGLIITDAMNMGAITEQYSSDEAAVLAILAGCDLILMPEDLPEAIQALRQAVEDDTISAARIDESVRRILTMKLEYGILSDQF